MNETDLNMIKKFLMGGAMVGTGAGLTTSLLNYLNDLHQAPMRERQADDDTLTLVLNRPKKPGQEKEAMMTGGLAMAGGILSTMGSYALVRQMYQEMKKRELQKELDRAQVQFADTSAEEARMKNASEDKMRGFSVMDTITSAPVASALLLMLGSGALTNAYLNKAWPAAREPKSPNPKRVRIKYRDPDEEQTKTASMSLDPAFEALVKIAYHMVEDRGSSDLVSVVDAYCEGRGSEIAQNLELGLDTALDGIKSAGLNRKDDDCLGLGIAAAVRDPEVGPALKLLACAEFNEHAPHAVKMASTLSGKEQDLFQALLGTYGALTRIPDEARIKAAASAYPDLAQALAQDLDPEEDLNMADEDNVEESVQGSDEAQLGSEDRALAEQLGQIEAEEDIIDQIMAGEQEPVET